MFNGLLVLSFSLFTSSLSLTDFYTEDEPKNMSVKAFLFWPTFCVLLDNMHGSLTVGTDRNGMIYDKLLLSCQRPDHFRKMPANRSLLR